MGYTKQSSASADRFPKWEWEKNPELECRLLGTRKGSGAGDGLTFHDVEQVDTGSKYSLLGNTILDSIFAEAAQARVKIVYTGEGTTKKGKPYHKFDWFKWTDDTLPPIESI